MKAYQLSKDEVLKKLGTDSEKGLSKNEVENKRKKYGLNKLPEEKKESYIQIFFRQFKDPLIYALIIGAAILFFIREHYDAILVTVILIFNSIIGTMQEGRAQALLESLKKLLKTNVVVIRNGKKEIIEDKYLVPGDIIILQEGEKVPADCRIIEIKDLKVDEAALTGESTPILKTDEALQQEARIYDQKNMAFYGTYVLSGEAKAVVVSIGLETEIGKISKDLKEIDTEFPLKEEINNLSKIIVGSILVFCIGLLIFGLISGRPIKELLITLSALFVGSVPEGLPLILTLILAIGANRMAKHKALIKRLKAVEVLGRVDVLMIDKTGTLTRNELMVSKVYTDDQIYEITGQGYLEEGEVLENEKQIEKVDPESKLYLTAVCCALIGQAEISYDKEQKLYKVKGEPIEAAMKIFAKKLGLISEEIEKEYELIHEIPFQSKEMYQASFYKYNSEYIAFMVGSPEVIMEHSKDLTENTKNEFQDLLDEGFRIIGIAYKKFDQLQDNKDSEFYNEKLNEMNFLAFLATEDAIRENVDKKVEEVKKAGIKIIMVTGDHKKTGQYVARKVGIIGEDEEVIEGPEFEEMSKEQKIETLKNGLAFARVTPKNKFDIVKLFHEQGLSVAMTGDGVNDAPALAASEIGIAMGNIGTDVAKSAADIILLDDSIFSIVYAIEQGRHTFYSLKRIITYYFATNAVEILLIFLTIVFQLPVPLVAGQILWINLVTDGFLDAALTVEPIDEETLINKWKYIKGKIIDKNLLFTILYMASIMLIGSFGVYYYYHSQDINKARVLTFVVVCIFQWFNAWNCKSLYKSLFKQNPFRNIWLILATLLVVALQIAAIYIPFLEKFLKTSPLSFYEWILLISIAFTVIIAEEIRKFILNRYFIENNN